jgi:membrane-anchored mycosin MYCP
VVLGFGGLFVAIAGAAVFQLRRAVRTPAAAPAEPRVGVRESVDSGEQT